MHVYIFFFNPGLFDMIFQLLGGGVPTLLSRTLTPESHLGLSPLALTDVLLTYPLDLWPLGTGTRTWMEVVIISLMCEIMEK